MSRTVDFNLYLITDRLSLPPDRHLLSQVEAALMGGVRCVQLREKDLSTEYLLPLAFELRQLTSAFGAKLLINGNLEIARAVDADGVHLGGDAMPVAAARKRLGQARLIGISTHHVDEIALAASDGADFVTFGPIYHTPSKAPYGAPVGLQALQKACAASPLPIFALGGITPERLTELRAAGCTRAACIGAILHADDPAAVTLMFRENLDA